MEFNLTHRSEEDGGSELSLASVVEEVASLNLLYTYKNVAVE